MTPVQIEEGRQLEQVTKRTNKGQGPRHVE